MVASTTPIFPEAVESAATTLVNADGAATVTGTNAKTLVTAGGDGCLVYSVNVSTDDTAAIDYSLYIQRDGSGTKYLLGTKSVPAASGNANATVAVDLLDPAYMKGLDGDGNLILGGTDLLLVGARTAVTSGKTTAVVASYGDF